MRRTALVGVGVLVLFCAMLSSGASYPERHAAALTPLLSNLSLTSTSGFDLTHDDLVCGFDLSGDATTAATAWYIGDSPPVPVMRLYLPFEGGAASALTDYSGNGITAVMHGDPTWDATAGHDGNGAFVFDGNDDISGGENFPTGSSYTKTAWVYRTGSGNNGGNNIMAGDANGGGHAFWAPDSYGDKLSAGHNGTWNSVQDGVALALNTWFFVAVSWDAATNEMVLYKNGEPIDNATVSALVTDATISVGSFGYSNGYMWKGTLDDVRLYNRALSAEQIQAMYYDGSNVIKYAETEVGDIWQARVTPFSSSEAGTTTDSDTLVVLAGSPIAPEITSAPATSAVVGELYTYDADATGSPAASFALSGSPAGMTINAYTGIVEWTPSAAGSELVSVDASNTAGTDNQTYEITITAGPVPEIENLAVTSTSGNDLPADDLTCSYDLAGVATTAATAWYVSGSPLSPLMRLLMPFEGGAANALNDYSGNGIVVSPHGDPTWNATAGHDGHGAFVFDGDDDLTAGENFPVGSSYTKTAWVYRTGSGANGGNNIMAGDANGGGHAFWAPDMYGNKLSAGHNGTWNSVQDDVALALNTWFFVALSWDAGSGKMVMYKDGVAIDSATVTAQVTDATISIGSFGVSNGYMWMGTLDDVRLYNRALTSEQIFALYNGPNVIRSTETDPGDLWLACVTPFSTSAAGVTACADTISIQAIPEPAVIVSAPVTTATVGHLYSYDVDAAGSPAPTYALTENPAGMTIDTATGLIEWTPAAAGSTIVNVVATNTAGSDSQNYTIFISEPPPCPLELVHYYKFDDAAEPYEDFILGNDGICVTDCPVFAASPINGAQWFDGENDEVDLADDGTFDWPSDASFTIEFWMKTNESRSGNRVIIGRDAGAASGLHWWIGMDGNRFVRFQCRDTSGGGLYLGGTGPVLNDDEWHHIVAVRDNDADVNMIYVDGDLIADGAYNYANGFEADVPVNVGYLVLGGYYRYLGNLDELAIYDRALPESEIDEHYANGLLGVGICTDVDIAPAIVSTPETIASVGELYTYDVNATGNPAPTFGLTANPAGMTIDPVSGLIQWTPAAAGSAFVTVEASNSVGSDTQSYAIAIFAPPALANLELTSTNFGLYATTDDLLCQYDLTDGAITAATSWYVSGSPLIPLMTLYLPFEGGAVNALNDYSGNGITTTPHGNAVWNATAGHDGFGAFVFDGNADIGAGENFPLSSSYTKTAWVYRTGSGANGGNNVMAGNENTGGHALWAPDMFSNHLSGGHDGTWNIVQDSVPLALNQWFFVALSFDYDTGVMRLYKDNVVVDSAVVDPAKRDVTDATISVGSFGAPNSWSWMGTLDDVRLYNRALTHQQVHALYSEGSDVIDAAETVIGQQWMACVTPFSANDAGVTVCTDSITIMDETVPVMVRSYESRWIDNNVEIRWVLHGVPGDLDFDVYRSVSDGPFDRLFGADIRRDGEAYVLVDVSAQPGREYTYRVSVIEDGRPVTSFDTAPTAAALKLALHQNHPNPFNPTTTIGFTLDAAGHVSLRVYDISGRLIRTLVDQQRAPGVFSEEWDGRNSYGEPAASGIYFYRLTAGNKTLTRKAVLLK